MTIVVLTFAVCLLMGIAIPFVLGISGIVHLLVMDNEAYLAVFAQRMFTGIDQFSLMCIPFFILAGGLMNKTGITERILGLANEMIGFLSGGLAYATVLVAAQLSAILGSANAVAVVLCSILVPSMKAQHYDEDFAAAVVASSAVMGPIIPPSITFVIYGMLTGVSVGKLFIAGIIPGLLLGLGYMIVIYTHVRKKDYPKVIAKPDGRRLLTAFLRAAPVLPIPLIIVGGVLLGVFTPTESGAVAVAVSIISGIMYRTLRLSDLAQILMEAAKITSAIMLIVAFANILGWTLVIDGIPQALSDGITGVTTDANMVLLLLLFALILIGCVVEGFAAMLIFAPMMYPLTVSVGIDPIHFGVIFALMSTLGLITPPVGMLLFVTSGVTDIPLVKLSRAVLPFAVAGFIVTFLVAFVPDLALFLPGFLD